MIATTLFRLPQGAVLGTATAACAGNAMRIGTVLLAPVTRSGHGTAVPSLMAARLFGDDDTTGLPPRAAPV